MLLLIKLCGVDFFQKACIMWDRAPCGENSYSSLPIAWRAAAAAFGGRQLQRSAGFALGGGTIPCTTSPG